MISRVEILTTVFDSRAEMRKKNKKIKSITLIDAYTIDKKLSPVELNMIGSAVSNPVTQQFCVRSDKDDKSFSVNKFDWAIEIGFLPGVTDNISHTVKQIIEDLLNIKFINNEGVYSSQITFVTGNLNNIEIEQITSSLFNPLIQRTHIKSYKQFIKDSGMDMIVPKVVLKQKPTITKVNLDISEEELIKIGKSGIINPDGSRRGPLALDIDYLKAIRNYFRNKKRDPNDIELESLAQTWSEHCKHTIFANPIDEIKDGLFKHYIKRATKEINKDFCVSVFNDNSGAIGFDEKYLITHKVETHNSPSALDPFGGAVTGIVGVNRDTLGFGLGAKPVANFFGFCFADPKLKLPLYRDSGRKFKMLPPNKIMDGVIEGVNAGGNQSGIPTPLGFIYFDNRFAGK